MRVLLRQIDSAKKQADSAMPMNKALGADNSRESHPTKWDTYKTDTTYPARWGCGGKHLYKKVVMQTERGKPHTSVRSLKARYACQAHDETYP